MNDLFIIYGFALAVLFWSFEMHTCYRIHFTMYWCLVYFDSIYTLFLGNLIFTQTLFVFFFLFIFTYDLNLKEKIICFFFIFTLGLNLIWKYKKKSIIWERPNHSAYADEITNNKEITRFLSDLGEDSGCSTNTFVIHSLFINWLIEWSFS